MKSKLFCLLIAGGLVGLSASCDQLTKVNPLTAKSSPEPVQNESNSKTEDSANHEKHWDYEENGPDTWASLDPKSQLCGEGKRQSPIDITNAKTAELPEVRLSFPEPK